MSDLWHPNRARELHDTLAAAGIDLAAREITLRDIDRAIDSALLDVMDREGLSITPDVNGNHIWWDVEPAALDYLGIPFDEAFTLTQGVAA